MRDVSCLVTASILEAVERFGVSPAAVLAGTGLESVHLCDTSRDLAWEEFVGFLDRVESVGGPDIWENVSQFLPETSWNRLIGALGRFAWTEEQFWRVIIRRVAPSLYPSLHFDLASLDDARFEVSVRIPPTQRGSLAYMRMVAELTRAGPPFLEGEREVEVDISPRLGRFEIAPAREGGLLARALRGLGGLVLGEPALGEFVRRHRESRRTAAQLESRNRSLATLQAVADALYQSLDFAGTAQRIVDTVAEHTGYEAVVLYTAKEDGATLEFAASCPQGPASLLPAELPFEAGLGGHRFDEQGVDWVPGAECYDVLPPPLRERLESMGMQAAVAVPLLFHDRTVGALGLASPGRRRLAPEDETNFLALGKTAAAALMSARHVARIEREAEERARAEARLRESEEQLRQVAENVEGVFFLADPRTHQLLYLSPAFERLTGRSVAWAMEEPHRAAEIIHPDDRQRVVDAIAAARPTGGYEVEYRLSRADGSIMSVLERATIVCGADGEPEGMVGFSQDVTEMRDLELQLRHSQKMEAVGRLAGGIAHDFNNLLTVISGYGEILRDRFDPGDADRETAEEILRAADRASSLTRRLLTLARKQPVRMTNLDLSVVVRELSGMLRSLLGEGVGLVLEVESGPLPVFGDRAQLEQVLVNLAVNARDAMPDGGSLFVSVGPREPDGVGLRVRDTGVGMDPEVRARVFEPFFSTKDPGRGTGLGLATVHGIVEQVGGRIGLDSAPGKGTTFDIVLPRVQGPDGPAEAPVGRAARGTETVLLVEDQPDVRSVAVRVLRARGYRVIEAGSADEALAVAESEAASGIDLLVTDVVMPGTSGTELAARIGRRLPRLPVLFVSGYVGEGSDAGASLATRSFLAKPFTPDGLAAAVRETLDTGGAPGA